MESLPSLHALELALSTGLRDAEAILTDAMPFRAGWDPGALAVVVAADEFDRRGLREALRGKGPNVHVVSVASPRLAEHLAGHMCPVILSPRAQRLLVSELSQALVDLNEALLDAREEADAHTEELADMEWRHEEAMREMAEQVDALQDEAASLRQEIEELLGENEDLQEWRDEHEPIIDALP